MQTYFGYFGHAWLQSPKVIVFNVSLHAKNIFHNSLLSYNITFQRILKFDRLAAFWAITWDPKLCQICWWNINNILVFIIDYFQEKLAYLNFSKNTRNPILGPFWVLLSKLGPKMNFPGKRGSASFSIFELPTTVPKIRKT